MCQACKIYVTVDLSSKLFSVVILTVMSIERYLVVSSTRVFDFTVLPTVLPVAIASTLSVLIPSLLLFDNAELVSSNRDVNGVRKKATLYLQGDQK